MSGVDRLDQYIAPYMIAHKSKKWWWPIFRFQVDLCTNNAFQIYRHQKENPGQKPLDLLGFRRSIVDKYYRRYRKTIQIVMFPSWRKKTKVSDDVRFGELSHWIGKVKQRRCAERGKTTLHFCEKCNVALHTKCFRDSTNSDRFTKWLAKKIIPLGTAVCNLFIDILTIFLCCL